MSAGPSPPARPVPRTHRWWLLFPFIWQAALAPLVNDIGFRPFGLPFPMAWQMVGIVLTSVVIAWVFRRDGAIGVNAEPAPSNGVGGSGGERA